MHIFINFIQLELDEMLNMREYLQLMMKKDCGRVVHFLSLERCFAFVVVLNLENSNHHRLRGIQTLTDTFTVRMCPRIAVELSSN